MQLCYKLCRRCRIRKLTEEFQPRGDGGGYRHICTGCRNKEGREKSATPLGTRARRSILMKHWYGITLEEYDELSAYQNYVCAICLEVCNTGQPLSVDHCHDTNEVRGLLCRRCNVAIGKLKSVELLDRAIEYLTGTRTVKVT